MYVCVCAIATAGAIAASHPLLLFILLFLKNRRAALSICEKVRGLACLRSLYAAASRAPQTGNNRLLEFRLVCYNAGRYIQADTYTENTYKYIHMLWPGWRLAYFIPTQAYIHAR